MIDKIEYAYFLSGNPTHQGHLNIAKKAYKITGEIPQFILGENPGKDGGLFTLEQRKQDLLLTLRLDSFFSNVDIEKLVGTCSIKDLSKRIIGSQHIIRGIRGPQDIGESLLLNQKLETLFNIKNLPEKTILIKQDKLFQEISSSRYIKIMKEILKDYDQIPYLCKKYATPTHFTKLHNIDTSKIKIDLETEAYMKQQIQNFFDGVNQL